MQRGVRYGAIGAGVVAALALVIVLFPWDVLRGPLAAHLSHRLERPVRIAGPLTVHLGFPTRVQVDDLSIGNAAWSDLQPMANARSIVLTFRLRSLFRGTPDTVQLVAPDIVLEKNASGVPNWRFRADGPSEAPKFGTLTVDGGTLRYRDPALRGDLSVAVQSTVREPGSPPALRFDGRGTLRGDRFTIEGEGHGASELREVGDPYQLSFVMHAGSTQIAFDGTVVPASPEDLRGALHLRGPDLSQLYPIVPSPLPWTPPYDLAGDLVHENNRWDFQNIKGTVGSSDLAGNFNIDRSRSRPRPLTTANLSSRKLDYKDLGGFVGLPPGEPERKANTPAQRQESEKRARSTHVLPDRPFDLAKLRDHDVDLEFRGTSVKWNALPLDNLTTHMTLNSGVMRFEPLDFGVADGHVVSHLTLDVTRRHPVAEGTLEIRRVELKRIFPRLASPNGSAGRFGGRARFRATGNSVADMFAGLSGDAAIAMRGGEASTLRLVLTNLDLARAASLLITGDQTAEIRCAVAALHAKDGTLVTDVMVIDTSAELIRGKGSVDFAREQYDLELAADSKQPSLVALRGPVMITGTFQAPIVKPAIGQAIARVGAAVGLGLLAPPLALLPLIDVGDAPDADCRALYAEAKIASDPTAGASDAPKPARAPRKPAAGQVARSQ